jgi:tRNA(His) guanylyltransferase
VSERKPEKGDSLGDRMKRYEVAARTSLSPRMPAIVRVDGKAFHTYTRGCARPFDRNLMDAMDSVAVRLCEQVQGAQMAYVQSDEVSILLHDYKRFASSAWFDKQVQKMASVAASLASSRMTRESVEVFGEVRECAFDARAFVLPESEVANYFIWRQQDATRNSIQMLARSLYSHRECHLKTCSDLQEMAHAKGANWNDLPTAQKRGRCVVRHPDGRWYVDVDPPIFTAARDYIERHLAIEPETVATPPPAAGAGDVCGECGCVGGVNYNCPACSGAGARK